MKHQLPGLFLWGFAFQLLFLSCKKEMIIVPETETISATQKVTEGGNWLPFKGSYPTTREILSPPPLLQARITGIGQASHLGQSKFIIQSTINFTTPPPFQLTGASTFYAANGDTFYTVFTGTSTPLADGTFLAIFNHTITGGTGRFQNASGSFTGRHIGHPVNPEGFTSIEGGTINYYVKAPYKL
ncbi:hypothetical protein [Terrimonas alba]|uniref:hypothetical protein n=1 Tax=Terrimonas alba TaxID=3349636 RepID=UPI0035F2D272